MKSVIIFKKDLDQFGKNLMREVYYHLHDNYFLKEYKEVKESRDYWDKNLVKEFIKFHKKDQLHFDCLYFKKISYEDLDKMTHENLLKKIEEQIKNKNIDLEIIFSVLKDLNLDDELSEDLYYDKKAFISFFNVFYNYSSYLEN